MYCVGSRATDIWFWTADMGWLWSGSAVYPSVFRARDDAWLWYLRDSREPRWFYNFRSAAWEQG